MIDRTDRQREQHELAVRIYVQLISSNTVVANESVTMSATPFNLAKLSLRFSEAFLQAEAEAIAAAEPVKNYQVGSDDISKWSK